MRSPVSLPMSLPHWLLFLTTLLVSTLIPAAAQAQTVVRQINAGGPAVAPYAADNSFSAGNTFSSTAAINLTGVTNPAPQAVYQTIRWNASFNYTLSGLTANSSYLVRLHFAELSFTAAGQRRFNVAINGTSVLTNFDIFATAGAANKAVVSEFTATANASGAIVVAFTQGAADNPSVAGIELYTGSIVQGPYLGTNWSIANGATIQAENYDVGGEGIAYHDTTAGNTGGVYRTDGVDIEASTDTGGGFNVGWTTDGEWLEYTTNTTAGTYNIVVRGASASTATGTKSVRVLLDGTVLGTATMGITGGWQTWQDFTISGVPITAGNNRVLRLEIVGGDFNFNYVRFASVSGTVPLTVTNGSGSGNYAAGTVVNLVANAAPAGQIFAGWTGGTAANFGNAASATTTYTTTAAAQTITATYSTPTTFPLTVVSGTGSGNYITGTVVNIVANAAPAGQVFAGWTGGTAANYGNAASATTTYTTTAAAQTITATYSTPTTFPLTVVSGTGSGNYVSGTVVNIVANAAPAGQVFAGWTGDTAANFGNAVSASTTYRTTSAAQTITATYSTPTTFPLTVVSGTGSGNYASGTVVNIVANAAPAGQVFAGWTGGTAANFGNAASASTTYRTTAAAQTITATYSTPLLVLTVVNGLGSGSYASGTVVTITANPPPAGQVFSGWTGGTAANFGNAASASTTYTTTATAQTITANYISNLGTNLAVGKPITASNTNAGFPVTNANDNSVMTYWESASLPATLTIDLGANANTNSVVVKLNPSWPSRSQTIQVLGHNQGTTTFTSLVPATSYTFNSGTNSVTIPVTASVSQVQLAFTVNNGAPGAQAAEFQIIGTFAPSATASPAGGSFNSTVTITLNASNPASGTYRWDSGVATSYTTGTQITAGSSWTVGESHVLTVANGAATNSYTFTKTTAIVTADPNQLRIYEIMVEAYQDGDPNVNYGVGYGPSNYRGDLKGITNALDYIKSLGMNAIWMTPIFNSNGSAQLDGTGYYCQDYFNIDPKFGTLQDAQALVNKAHSLGMYVFFDGVFGHHKAGVFPSPTGQLPTGSDNPVSYPGSLAFYKEVATYWINTLGIDGWRVDQAYQVPVADWTEIRTAVEAASLARKNAGQQWGTLGYMVGEFWEAETDIASQGYGPVSSPGVKSNFDFPLRYALVQVLATQEDTTQSGAFGQTAARLNTGYQTHNVYPAFAEPNLMMSNHDLVRFGDLIQRDPLLGYGPENPDYWKRYKAALSFLTAFTGPITLLYGEEYGDQVNGFVFNGDSGWADDNVARDNGRITGFNANETDLITYVKALMAMRDANPALWKGTRTNLIASGNQYADLKVSGTNSVLYLLNIGTASSTFTLSQTAVGGTKLTDLLTGTVINASGGTYSVPVGALTPQFLLVQ